MGFFRGEKKELRSFDEQVLSQTREIGRKFGAVDPFQPEVLEAKITYGQETLSCSLLPLSVYGDLLLRVNRSHLELQFHDNPFSSPAIHRIIPDGNMPDCFWVLDLIYMETLKSSRGKGHASLLAHIGDNMIQVMAEHHHIPIYAYSCKDISPGGWSTAMFQTFDFRSYKKNLLEKITFARPGIHKWYLPD